MALPSDLVLDSTAAIGVGTLPALTLSLTGGVQSIRSEAAYALTAPRTLRIAHAVRRLKGLRDQASNILAPDVVFDRHLVRFDSNVAQTKYLDPEFLINQSIQLVIEIPRLGASSPTPLDTAGRLKALVSMLTAASNANLFRVLNNES